MRARTTVSIVLLFVELVLVASWADAEERQVSQVKARHQSGQTFLSWKEVAPEVRQDRISVVELRKIKAAVSKDKQIFYRIYRSSRPITSVQGLKPIAEVLPLSGWNGDFYGANPKPKDMALRYVVEDGKEPVTDQTGIYVHNSPEAGTSYYAVTLVTHAKENTNISKDNSLQIGIEETVGQGVPILQRVVKPDRFQFITNPTLHYYVRWESSPNSSIPSKPFDYLVAIPPKLAKPAPVGIHLHGWGGSLNGGYGWWYNAEKGAILIASNEIPYDWWTGYHERLWSGSLKTKADWANGFVRPYSQRRMLAFLDWVSTNWEVDLSRTFAAGNSMGGSGSVMLALRFPERIAWAMSWVGVHSPIKSPRFKSSYANVYGKPEWEVKFEDGTPVWNYFDDTWYLRRYPDKEIGFVTFSNGKNDNGIGWPQAVDFYRALQETRRPHLFVWGQAGHSQRGIMPRDGGQRTMPIDMRTDQSLPAFTNCSLDQNPGNGDPSDGDPQGQINAYLYWETANIVDESGSWEITIGLINKAPQNSATVDMTPRRLQKFKVSPGERIQWTNISLKDRKTIQSGQVIADRRGLMTIEKIQVGKGKNRILFTK